MSVYSEAMGAVALVIRQLPSYLGIGVNPSRQWSNVLVFDHSRLGTLDLIQPLILNPYFALLYLRVKPQYKTDPDALLAQTSDRQHR